MEKKVGKKPTRQSSLETANEMYKQAFLVKRTRLTVENPNFSEAEIDRLTAQYFKQLGQKK